ncbi:MAG: tetratricopeptide repeat protein [Acidobacteriota bacterium]
MQIRPLHLLSDSLRLFLTRCAPVALAASTALAQEAPAGPPAVLVPALEAFDRGDLDEAVRLLEEVVAGADVPLPALGILGGLYVERGEGDRALPLLQKVIEAGQANPAVLFNAGRAAQQSGNPELGAEYLQQAARLAPASPAARALGLLRGRQGRAEEAYVILRPWVLSNPGDTEARLAAALGAVELRRVPEAEQLLGELPQTDPGVQLLWGRLLMLKGEPWGAVGYLQPLLESAPPALAADVRRLLADAYLTVGESDLAIQALEGQESKDVRASTLLSQAYFRNGRIDDALKALEASAQRALDPQQPMPIDDRSKALLAHGQHLIAAARHSEALPFLEAGTEIDPRDKLGWQALGQALAADGRRDEAKEALAMFTQLDSAEVETSLNQAQRDLEDPTGRELRESMQLLVSGSPERALERLQREAQISPQDPRPLLFLSRAYLMMAQPENALAAARNAVALAPGSPDALYSIATAQMALQDFAAAENGFRSLLESHPEYTPAMNDLAVLLIEDERPEEAKPLFERILSLNPDDPVAAENLRKLSG